MVEQGKLVYMHLWRSMINLSNNSTFWNLNNTHLLILWNILFEKDLLGKYKIVLIKPKAP